MWDNIQLRGLDPVYHNKEFPFGKWVRSFFALLLPSHKVEEGFVSLKSSRPNSATTVSLLTRKSALWNTETFWMGEMRDKPYVGGSAHCTNNNAESFNRELRPTPGSWVFMKKVEENISRTVTDLERVKNGEVFTSPKTVSETQRRIEEARAKLEIGQLTVQEFINNMKYVGWKGVRNMQGNNIQAEADLPEADLVDGDLDVDLQDIKVDLMDVSLQNINAEHYLQEMLADSLLRTMPTYTLPRTRSTSTTSSSTARAT